MRTNVPMVNIRKAETICQINLVAYISLRICYDGRIGQRRIQPNGKELSRISRGLTGAVMRRSYLKKMTAAAVVLSAFLSVGCEKTENKFSIFNIAKASATVIKEKGVFDFSAEAVNEEIEKMYSSPDDILQKKSYLRNRDSDGSNNYRIILEDRIDDDNYQRERTKKDPFRK